MFYSYIIYNILHNVSYNLTASGIKSKSNLNKTESNNVVTSFGNSSLSYKQLFNFSDNSAISGAFL